MWLAVAGPDLPAARAALDEHWARDLDPRERAASELVVDFDAEETTCPACLTSFAPTDPRCPSCGLRFG